MMVCIIIIIIIIIVSSVIMENVREREDLKRLETEFYKNKALAQKKKDQDCANGKHICDGSGNCKNCGAFIPEDNKHFCKCWWRGEVPYYGHQICDDCCNLRFLKR